jgi:hypothetical protein
VWYKVITENHKECHPKDHQPRHTITGLKSKLVELC